ncbi:MAG: hypothetical protein HYT93_00150 [Parcubacteria group bacterium]|nr:hypothetical protein [Parcubacteria group bacterium]
MESIYKKNVLLPFLFLFVVAMIIFYIKPNSSLAHHAASILQICATEEYKPACYDREIPKLMDTELSMENAFAVTKLIQQKDDSYFYCHVLGHNLSAKETAKDPSRWKEVIARTPSGMCSNGGIHGAFQERFRAEALPEASVAELEPILTDICNKRENWNPTRLEQATCTHAVGHLVMYVTGGDIHKSLALCEKVAFNEEGYDFKQICFDGAFMQIFQPLEPEDYVLIKGREQTRETVNSFCEKFTGARYGSCRSESWPLFHEEIKTAPGLTRFCSFQKDFEQKERCYSGMFYVLTAEFNLDPIKIENLCEAFPQELKNKCFANAASRMIETDWSKIPDAISLCAISEKHGAGDACYRELLLYSNYNFHPRSKEFYSLCRHLPNGWEGKCLSG